MEAPFASPDPVAEPQAYQRLLLSLVADDDPAEVQAATPAEVRRLLESAGPDLRRRPAPGEWSVLECVGHIVDAEVVSAGRYRWILAHDEPPLIGYDQDRWVERLRHQDDEPTALLALFEPLRAANLALWRSTDTAERARVGRHAERGPESLELSFRLIAGHDRFHLRQAWQTLEMVRGGPSRG
ncbi:MAG TPA: DinB family protein [Candidatus Limnocylindrales bacterium]|nr:DinB family protein [Candidatus Limnocylindrales bacterium]